MQDYTGIMHLRALWHKFVFKNTLKKLRKLSNSWKNIETYGSLPFVGEQENPREVNQWKKLNNSEQCGKNGRHKNEKCRKHVRNEAREAWDPF